MRPQDITFERTDIWREGQWLDLWSVVHVLSGILLALGLYFLHLGAFSSVVIALLLLISYEMWEAMVGIEETPANRCMDVVVGMAGFLLVFFCAPLLSQTLLILAFGLIGTIDVVMSVFGWQASQKAAALEQRMRARYAKERARLLKRKSQLSERLRR
jgi:hypothetical protein